MTVAIIVAYQIAPEKIMQDTISIVTFIDALGWEVLKGRQFMEEELPHRQKVRSVFGYSSACIPTILSGRLPRDHNHWSFYYYDSSDSPFKKFKWLRFFPGQGRGRVRSKLSSWVKKWLSWDGYFQFYNMPFKHIDLFNYCEQNDIFAAGGLNRGKNITDYLEEAHVPYHMSNWRNDEQTNLLDLKNEIEKGDIKFAFLYMASMDGLLHQVGKHHQSVDTKLAWYENQLKDLIDTASRHYDNVRLFVCSDHGMATVEKTINIMPTIESLGWEYGKDYVAAYDSTMARFWFFSKIARKSILAALSYIPEGRVLTRNELIQLGCDFDGDRFGESIFLVDPGIIICPSHMGTRPIKGMHGYHPEHRDSDAVLLSNEPPPVSVSSLTDLCALMRMEAGCPVS